MNNVPFVELGENTLEVGKDTILLGDLSEGKSLTVLGGDI